MSVFSAGTRGHYTNPYLIQATPKNTSQIFVTKKIPQPKISKPSIIPVTWNRGSRQPTPPPPPPQHPSGVWIISNFEKPKIARNRDSSTVLYCTVLCCAVILLVSIEDMCIAHVQTNIFIIESVCDRWAKLTAMKLWSTKLYFVEFFSCIFCTFAASYLIVSSWWYHGREMEKQVSFTTYRNLHSETALETPSLPGQCGQLRFCWEKKLISK